MYNFIYLAKEKLNSQVYDSIMETLKLSEKLNADQSNKVMDESLDKIKQIQDFDEVIAVSQLNELDTIQFLTSNQIKNMSILINDDSNILKLYEKFNRFEMVINNLQVEIIIRVR